MTVWFALVFFVFLETRSVMATSIVSGIYIAAVALSGFWIGSLVDRYRKKRVMLASGFVSLFIYAVGFAVYRGAPPGAFKDPGGILLWVFVPLLLAGVIAGNVRTVALPTLITVLIPEDRRDKANGLSGTATGIVFLVTSAISGFLVAHSGMQGVLILAMVMMVVSILHLAGLPLAEGNPAAASGRPPKLDFAGPA